MTKLFALATAFALSALAAPARATPPGESGGLDAGGVALTLALPGAIAAALTTADVYYAAHGELAPTGLAVTEIVGGSILTAGCPLLALVMALSQQPEVAIANLVFTGVGVGLITHGAVSLVHGEPDTSVQLAGVSIVPTAGGAAGSLAFRF